MKYDKKSWKANLQVREAEIRHELAVLKDSVTDNERALTSIERVMRIIDRGGPWDIDFERATMLMTSLDLDPSDTAKHKIVREAIWMLRLDLLSRVGERGYEAPFDEAKEVTDHILEGLLR